MEVNEVASRRVFWNTVGNFAEAFAKELAKFGPGASRTEADYALGVALDTVAMGRSSEMPWTPTCDAETFVKACEALQCFVEGPDQPLVEYVADWDPHELRCAVCKKPFTGTKDQFRRKREGKRVVCSMKCRGASKGGTDDEIAGAVQVSTAGRPEDSQV